MHSPHARAGAETANAGYGGAALRRQAREFGAIHTTKNKILRARQARAWRRDVEDAVRQR
jgi:hypothetical protein